MPNKKKTTKPKGKKRKYEKREHAENIIMFFCIFISEIYGGWCFLSNEQLARFALQQKNILLAFFLFTAFLIADFLSVGTFRKFRVVKQPKKKKYRMTDICRMSGEEFEFYLLYQFQRMRYHVSHTGKSGDFGADLILMKWGRKTVVQAKRYSKPVGVRAVQEVISAKMYYKADRALVVTNYYFTTPAKKLADRCGVILWDGDTLAKKFFLR